MNDELRHDQAALYVMSMLSPAEERAFEQELNDNLNLRQLVGELRDAAATVASGLEPHPPPEALKKRVFEAIDATENAREGANLSESNRTRSNWRPALWVVSGWLSAACLLIAVWNGEHRAAGLQNELKLAREERDSALKAAETVRADADALNSGRLVRLESKVAGANGSSPAVDLIWNQNNQSGTILLDGFPAAADGKDYQLWIVDPEYKNPVDCGVFAVQASGTITVKFNPKSKVHQASKFAVTLEKKGGVPVAEGSLVLIGG